MEGKVSIILLNYCGYQDTTDCVNSLRKVLYKNLEIIIVDNQSNDGSYEKLKKENRDCVVLLSPTNNGFSAGNNIGIKYAMEHDTDYIMLLNNDTEVQPDFISKMIEVADKNTVVTPSIYFYSNKNEVWYADGKISKLKCTVSNGSNKRSKYCDYASGCCLLIPRDVIEKVGYWAEEYFMYYEDMDYSLRLKNAGVKIYYKNDAVVYHKVGKSAGVGSRLNIYYNVRNRFYIIDKYDFGKMCYVYSIFTRILRYLRGIFLNTNEIVTRKAFCDYSKHKMGKIENI